MSADPLPMTFEWATEAARYLRTLVPSELKTPVVGIICGSGLGGLADSIHHDEARAEAAYVDIPHFPRVTGMETTTQRVMMMMMMMMLSL